MSNFYVERSPDYLEHHGILGMKWGVRRFQNKDGSLTPEGRARYGDVLTKKQMKTYIRDYNLRTGENKKINKHTVFKTDHGLYDYKGNKIRTNAEVSDPGAQTKTETKPKNESRMSDEELKAANMRMAMEEEYIRHMNNLNPKKVSFGKQFADNLKNDLVKDIPAGISGMISNAIKSAGNQKPSNDEKPDKRTETNVDINKLNDRELKEVNERLKQVKQYEKYMNTSNKDNSSAGVDFDSLSDEDFEKLREKLGL